MYYEKKDIVVFYAETPVHPGTASGWGAVDLPVQRESFTGLPFFAASGIKGAMRHYFERQATKPGRDRKKIADVFGPSPEEGAPDHAGAMAVVDAKLLLFPVRSLYGVFAYLTCPLVLQRFQRDLEVIDQGTHLEKHISEIHVVGDNARVVAFKEDDEDSRPAIVRQSASKDKKYTAIFEEYAFVARPDDHATKVAEFLRDSCFPNLGIYNTLRSDFPKRFAIVPDDVFVDFTRLGAEIITRNRIDDATGTAADGGLWTEEHLPSETVLYSVLLWGNPKGHVLKDATQVGEFVKGAGIRNKDDFMGIHNQRLQMGGDQTVGRGMVLAHFVECKTKQPQEGG